MQKSELFFFKRRIASITVKFQHELESKENKAELPTYRLPRANFKLV
jgi:hypothetical protein